MFSFLNYTNWCFSDVFKTEFSHVTNRHAKILCLHDFCITGLLHVGDEVLEVEGRSVTGKTPDEVVQMLVRMDNWIFSSL